MPKKIGEKEQEQTTVADIKKWDVTTLTLEDGFVRCKINVPEDHKRSKEMLFGSSGIDPDLGAKEICSISGVDNMKNYSIEKVLLAIAALKMDPLMAASIKCDNDYASIRTHSHLEQLAKAVRASFSDKLAQVYFPILLRIPQQPTVAAEPRVAAKTCYQVANGLFPSTAEKCFEVALDDKLQLMMQNYVEVKTNFEKDKKHYQVNDGDFSGNKEIIQSIVLLTFYYLENMPWFYLHSEDYVDGRRSAECSNKERSIDSISYIVRFFYPEETIPKLAQLKTVIERIVDIFGQNKGYYHELTCRSFLSRCMFELSGEATIHNQINVQVPFLTKQWEERIFDIDNPRLMAIAKARRAELFKVFLGQCDRYLSQYGMANNRVESNEVISLVVAIAAISFFVCGLAAKWDMKSLLSFVIPLLTYSAWNHHQSAHSQIPGRLFLTKDIMDLSQALSQGVSLARYEFMKQVEKIVQSEMPSVMADVAVGNSTTKSLQIKPVTEAATQLFRLCDLEEAESRKNTRTQLYSLMMALNNQYRNNCREKTEFYFFNDGDRMACSSSQSSMSMVPSSSNV